MSNLSSDTSLLTRVRALSRLYEAASGTAIGLASITLEGFDQQWRDRIQRTRILPREAPKRKQLIAEMLRDIEAIFDRERGAIQQLQPAHSALVRDALQIADRALQPSDS